MRTVRLSASICGGLSMTAMKDDGNRANVEEEGTASTETDDLEAMMSG